MGAKTNKTVKDYLEQLKEPYKTKALNNTGALNKNRKVDSMNEALMSAFWWQGSPEGYKYWFDCRDNCSTES